MVTWFGKIFVTFFYWGRLCWVDGRGRIIECEPLLRSDCFEVYFYDSFGYVFLVCPLSSMAIVVWEKFICPKDFTGNCHLFAWLHSKNVSGILYLRDFTSLCVFFVCFIPIFPFTCFSPDFLLCSSSSINNDHNVQYLKTNNLPKGTTVKILFKQILPH